MILRFLAPVFEDGFIEIYTGPPSPLHNPSEGTESSENDAPIVKKTKTKNPLLDSNEVIILTDDADIQKRENQKIEIQDQESSSNTINSSQESLSGEKPKTKETQKKNHPSPQKKNQSSPKPKKATPPKINSHPATPANSRVTRSTRSSAVSIDIETKPNKQPTVAMIDLTDDEKDEDKK